jgi:hypothetical protein
MRVRVNWKVTNLRLFRVSFPEWPLFFSALSVSKTHSLLTVLSMASARCGTKQAISLIMFEIP